ncbi:MAG: hypothetical protein KDI56_17560, partial [Xanthomonadales bacterium]|nr:hypothetical protein [Xanthomonadales bacterium]
MNGLGSTFRRMGVVVAVLGANMAFAFGDCEPGNYNAIPVCGTSARQLHAELPGLQPGLSSLVGNDSLIGGGVVQSNSASKYVGGPGGAACPNFVICVDGDNLAYREIDVDYAGSFSRVSVIGFQINTSERESMIAAGVASLAFFSAEYNSVTGPSPRVTFFIEPGPSVGQLKFLWSFYDGSSRQEMSIIVSRSTDFPVQAIIESYPEGNERTRLIVDGQTILDSPGMVFQSEPLRPKFIRYGNLGTVSILLQPEVPLKALTAS